MPELAWSANFHLFYMYSIWNKTMHQVVILFFYFYFFPYLWWPCSNPYPCNKVWILKFYDVNTTTTCSHTLNIKVFYHESGANREVFENWDIIMFLLPFCDSPVTHFRSCMWVNKQMRRFHPVAKHNFGFETGPKAVKCSTIINPREDDFSKSDYTSSESSWVYSNTWFTLSRRRCFSHWFWHVVVVRRLHRLVAT